jgi:ribosomal protein S6--L-glutamate ligase
VHAFLAAAVTCERTGQRGFLLQEMIPAGDRSLRVVVIGRRRVAYWRVQPDRHLWGASLARGGQLDTAADPDLRAAAVAAVGRFCAATRIDLAGFDLLFAEGDPAGVPYFLEINYFFGRRGLGGSEAYYRSLLAEINAWLGRHNLAGPRAVG